MSEPIDPMAVVVAYEMARFRDTRRLSPIISRSHALAAWCNLPPHYAWLMAANALYEENKHLRRLLADAISRG